MSAKTSVTLLTFDRLDIERLKDFYNLLSKLKYINEILEVFKKVKHNFKSAKLRSLLSMKSPNVVSSEVVTVKEE